MNVGIIKTKYLLYLFDPDGYALLNGLESLTAVSHWLTILWTLDGVKVVRLTGFQGHLQQSRSHALT